jgi:hypothetical protein
MKRACFTALFVALTLTTVGAASGAPGESEARKKEAMGLFNLAVKQAQTGDEKTALASFRLAYEKYPSFRVLYNIAQLCGRMGDFACAVKTYEQYLRDGGADVPAKRRDAVEKEIANLAKNVATMTLKSSTAGAEVTVDDASVGRTPLGEVGLNPGSHKIALSYDGKTADKTIKVSGGESVTVELELPKPEPPPPPPAPPPPKTVAKSDDKEKGSKPFPIVPWSVTGAFGVATVVTGVLAASAYGDFKDKRDSFPVTREELDDAQSKARDLLLLTGLFGTITVVSAGVAGYFTFLAPGARETSTAKSRLNIAFAPNGIVLSGVMP